MYLANTSQTASALGLEVSPEIPRIVGIVRFAETYRKSPFVLRGSRPADGEHPVELVWMAPSYET